MANWRQRGPTGKKEALVSTKDGYLTRRTIPAPGSIGVKQKLRKAAANGVLQRIKKWRNFANWTGLYPNAIKAMDHYLSGTGTFVEIPSAKVDSVRIEAESAHLQKAKAAFKRAAVLEAGAAWLAAKGFLSNGGELKPKLIKFTLSWQSGKSSGGVTDDNLTYYGSSIMSEVLFQAKQVGMPSNLSDEEFSVHLQVIEWKSWVVDNYDWEGDKEFGFFPKLGLPTQKEMNSLQKHGLARSYQRSSRSWKVESHGFAAWTSPIASFNTFREVAVSRSQAKQEKENDRRKDQKKGALPTPRPAEEVLKNVNAPVGSK